MNVSRFSETNHVIQIGEGIRADNYDSKVHVPFTVGRYSCSLMTESDPNSHNRMRVCPEIFMKENGATTVVIRGAMDSFIHCTVSVLFS